MSKRTFFFCAKRSISYKNIFLRLKSVFMREKFAKFIFFSYLCGQIGNQPATDNWQLIGWYIIVKHNLQNMKKVLLVLPALMMCVAMMAEPKPLRVLVLGDDPMMVTDEANNAVGYATMLQPLFDDAVTVEVQASATQQQPDPAALLAPASKGDVVMLCKLPVEVDAEAEGKTQADVYLEQLQAIQQAAKKKGVKLIWLTPACPRYFTPEGTQVHRMGVFPEVVRRMCKRDEMQLIDVEMITFNWLTEAGMDSTAKAFVPVVPATQQASEKVAREGNLLSEAGAQQVAARIGDAIRADKRNLLYKRLKQEKSER